MNTVATSTGPWAEAVVERARAGARVRVLLDAWDAHQIERSLLTQMDEAGVHIAWFPQRARVA